MSPVQCLNGRQDSMTVTKRCWPDTMPAIRNFSRTPLPFTVQRPRPSYRVHKRQSSLQCVLSALSGQQGLLSVDTLRSVVASKEGGWWETFAQITSASNSDDLRPTVLFVLFNVFLCGLVYRHCRKSRPLKGLVNEKVEIRDLPNGGKTLHYAADVINETYLGYYPGRRRTEAEMDAKIRIAPAAAEWAFESYPGYFVDPTDEQGRLSQYPGPGPDWPEPINLDMTNIKMAPAGSPGTAQVKSGEGIFSLGPRTVGEEVTLSLQTFCQRFSKRPRPPGYVVPKIDPWIRRPPPPRQFGGPPPPGPPE